MKGYTTQDAARLLGLPARRIRSYARAGFVAPTRGPGNRYLFSFQDLVLLRAAADLARGGVPARRITRALQALQRSLPTGRSLSELRIESAGDDVVARSTDEPPWSPRSGQFHLEFAVADLATEVAPLARSLSNRAHESEGSAAEWYELGLELEPVAPAEAHRAYERAVEADPGHADARVNLGRLLHDMQRNAEAEAHFRAVLESGPHPLAYYNLGVVLEDTERLDEAVRAYQRALDIDGSLAEAHYNLARLHERRGDQFAAIRHFNGYRALTRGR